MKSEVPTQPLHLALEDSILDLIGEGPAALVIPSDSPFFAPIADVEAAIFPETPALFDVKEAADLFQFMVIVVESSARHVVRLSAPGLLRGRTDLYPFFLTDLVDAGELQSIGELETFYGQLDVDLGQSLSVETNFRLGPHLEPVRSADLAYLSLFSFETAVNAEALFAHLNTPAISSLERVGINWNHVADREHLQTPTLNSDGKRTFDPDYQPVCIVAQDPANKVTIDLLATVTPPVHFL